MTDPQSVVDKLSALIDHPNTPPNERQRARDARERVYARFPDLRARAQKPGRKPSPTPRPGVSPDAFDGAADRLLRELERAGARLLNTATATVSRQVERQFHTLTSSLLDNLDQTIQAWEADMAHDDDTNNDTFDDENLFDAVASIRASRAKIENGDADDDDVAIRITAPLATWIELLQSCDASALFASIEDCLIDHDKIGSHPDIIEYAAQDDGDDDEA